MESNRFALDTKENNKLINIVRIVFGIVCVVLAVFWTWFNINAFKSDGTLWITIIFLAGFGIYQVFTGLGRTSKYIEIGINTLIIRNRSIFKAVELKKDDIEKIDFYPLNMVFFLKSGKRMIVRFGTTWYETNEKIFTAVGGFAERNNIPVEVIEENL